MMVNQQVDDSQSLAMVSDTPKWALLSRSIFSGGLAGVIAGVLFLGIGSRLAMRVVTLPDPQAEGTLTDADQVVGAITLGGTVALIVFAGGFGGIFAGGIWIMVRETLPERLSFRIPLSGVIATLVASFTLIDASNSDFRLFDPAGFNVAMFMMLILLTGSATAYRDRVLQACLPRSAASGLLYASLVALGAFLALPMIFSFFFVSGAAVDDPPRVAGGFLLITLFGTLLGWTRYTAGHTLTLSKASKWIGTIGLAGLVVFSGVYLVNEIIEIL